MNELIEFIVRYVVLRWLMAAAAAVVAEFATAFTRLHFKFI